MLHLIYLLLAALKHRIQKWIVNDLLPTLPQRVAGGLLARVAYGVLVQPWLDPLLASARALYRRLRGRDVSVPATPLHLRSTLGSVGVLNMPPTILPAAMSAGRAVVSATLTNEQLHDSGSWSTFGTFQPGAFQLGSFQEGSDLNRFRVAHHG